MYAVQQSAGVGTLPTPGQRVSIAAGHSQTASLPGLIRVIDEDMSALSKGFWLKHPGNLRQGCFLCFMSYRSNSGPNKELKIGHNGNFNSNGIY